MPQSTLAETLTPLLGSAFVADSPQDCAPFAVHGLLPGCVAAPATVAEMAATLAAAHERGAAVVPWGGGTKQLIGKPPERVDLVVRTERLNRVLIHEPDDLTISVEAGMTLGALRSHLAQFNQCLPIDPPLPDQATIGGLIATAMDGPRRLGFGTLRDLLIGVGVVEASGRISKAGGMVVKNVSGFDLMKLYHGSFGTLALITSANFKLLPMPRASAVLLARFSDLDAAFGFLDALHDSQLLPSAAELLSATALAALDMSGQCAVTLLAEGVPQAVARHTHDLSALATAHGGNATNPDDGLWSRIADLPQTGILANGETVIKLAVLPSQLHRVLAQILAAAPAAQICARALNGVAYVRLHNLEQRLLDSLPGVQWLASQNHRLSGWGQPPAGINLMQQIKHEFDPQNMLNPGRFIV